jgi:uncharacterized protein (DUF362 family)
VDASIGTNNPFLTDPAHPSVVVTSGTDAYENTRSALRGVNLSVARGMKVLLKPNAGRMAAPGSGVCTDPRVVAAAIDAFIDAGAAVAVGESPITGVRALEALAVTGIAAVANQRGVRLVDFDARRPVRVPIPEGIAIHELKLCADVADFDLVVSMPVMKTHMHTGVTLSVKNMKGCLWRRSKVDLHMLPPIEGHDDKSLNVAIADMASVLRPHLSIVDGTVGMQGLGPSAGTPRSLGVVVVSADPFAADAVACELMGKCAATVPHLRMGGTRGLGVLDITRLDISPAHWRSFGTVFDDAPENLAFEFPDVNVLDRNSCSACQSTVLMFLQRHSRELFDYLGDDRPVNIAIGKGHDDVPERTLCIGNCTGRHKNRGIYVRGCPPVSSSIVRSLEQWYRKKR